MELEKSKISVTIPESEPEMPSWINERFHILGFKGIVGMILYMLGGSLVSFVCLFLFFVYIEENQIWYKVIKTDNNIIAIEKVTVKKQTV